MFARTLAAGCVRLYPLPPASLLLSCGREGGLVLLVCSRVDAQPVWHRAWQGGSHMVISFKEFSFLGPFPWLRPWSPRLPWGMALVTAQLLGVCVLSLFLRSCTWTFWPHPDK